MTAVALRLNHGFCTCTDRRHRTVEDVEAWYGTLVFYRQVNNGDEVCAVARVARPDAVDYYVMVTIFRLVVGIDLSLQLCNEIIVVFFVGAVLSSES